MEPARGLRAYEGIDRRWTGASPAFKRVKKLKSGWIGPVRPSRQPLCGFLRMRWFLNAINEYLMVRSAKGASRTTHDGCAAPGFRPEANSFTCSVARAGPSRQPLRGFLRVRRCINAINDTPRAEERPRGASRSTHDDLCRRSSVPYRFRHTLLTGGLASDARQIAPIPPAPMTAMRIATLPIRPRQMP